MAFQRLFSFLRVPDAFTTQLRTFRKREFNHINKELKKKNYYPDALCIEKYNMKYYPRFPDYKDPPYEPTKLFMVRRVKPLKGTPYWDRRTLERLNLDGKTKREVIIVKNTKEINRKLWTVRHLVEITPIVFPNGEPTEADIERSVLNHLGEISVGDHLKADPQRVEAMQKFLDSPVRLNGTIIAAEARNRWSTSW